MLNSTGVLRSALLIFISIFLIYPATAQQRVYISTACNWGASSTPSSVTAYPATERARQVVDRILSHTHHEQNFVVRTADVKNAMATRSPAGRRLILYNSAFMRNLVQNTGTPWSATGVLAHEVGHHLGKHLMSNRTLSAEVEADHFAGFVLQKMGASRAQVRSFGRGMGDNEGALGYSPHPRDSKRTQAALEGFDMAKAGLSSPLRHDLEEAYTEGNAKQKRLRSRRNITFQILNLKIAKAKRSGARWDTGVPGARGLLPDPYTVVYVNGRQICSSVSAKNNLEPMSGLTCSFAADGNTQLTLWVMDDDSSFSEDDVISSWTGTVNQLLQQNQKISQGSLKEMIFSVDW
jgi:hypothetical protein